jgi:hypothetical protein
MVLFLDYHQFLPCTEMKELMKQRIQDNRRTSMDEAVSETSIIHGMKQCEDHIVNTVS